MNSQAFHRPIKFIVLAVCVFGLLLLCFFINEARKEIYFLCGNFDAGDSFSRVVRQLDTVNLSEYSIEVAEQGKRIIHSSKLNLHMVSCNIELNHQDEVVSVSYG